MGKEVSEDAIIIMPTPDDDAVANHHGEDASAQWRTG